MKRSDGQIRFSLESLIAVVMVFASAFAIAKVVGVSRATIIFVLFALLWASTWALFERRRRSWFWTGFAVIGWLFFVIFPALVNWLGMPAVFKDLFTSAQISPFGKWMSINARAAMYEFFAIVHGMLTLFVASVAGLAAQRLFTPRADSKGIDLTAHDSAAGGE